MIKKKWNGNIVSWDVSPQNVIVSQEVICNNLPPCFILHGEIEKESENVL